MSTQRKVAPIVLIGGVLNFKVGTNQLEYYSKNLPSMRLIKAMSTQRKIAPIVLIGGVLNF